MAKSDDYKNRLDTLAKNKDATSLAKPDDDTKALQDNFANSDNKDKGSWANQKLSGQVVEVEMQQEQQQEQQQQQQQQNQQEQEKDRDDSGDMNDINVSDEKRRDYKAVSEHLARALFKHDLMSSNNELTSEQAEEYIDKLDEVRDRETDKVVKKQYFREVFTFPNTLNNEQLEHIVGLATSSDNYQEEVVSYLEEKGKTVPDDLWQKLESKYDALVESNKDSIANLTERALSEELPPHLKDIKFSKYKFSEHTTFSYREDYLSNKLASAYTDELVAKGDAPGIKYLSEAALKQVAKDPDYFRNGVINNGKALSLPPGFVMGPVEPGSQSMILHYDSSKVEPMQQVQLEKASKDKSFHMMNHRSFEDNPENRDAQRLWSLDNKKVHVGSSRVDNKFKGDLSERFFEENGTLKSGHNFAYFGEDNKAEVEAVFKEKLEALSDNIDKSMDNKKDRGVLKSYIYEAVLKNKTDLSAFLVGEELASLNSMIAMDKKDMQKFYTAVVVPNQMSPKVSSFGELQSSYEAYSKFVDSLNVSKEHKKKLYKVGYADSGKEDNTCRIRFDDPKVGLARLQYIVDKASDKTLQVDNIERIEVRSHDSAFQVKRNNADLPIITESFNTVSADRESLSAARLTPQERLKTVKEHSGYVSPIDNENTNKFDENRAGAGRLELSNKLKSFDAGFVTTVFSTMRTGNLHQLNMLGNAAYLVSFDNKGDDKDEKTKSTVAKDQNYAQDMAYNIGPYLNSLTRSGTNPDILLAHISSQIVQEKEGTKGEYELNPNVRSMGEIHAILSASIINKQEAENEAWHESKAALVDSIISASASFEGEERRAFFAALRVTNEPEKFIETITQNALAENSQEKQSQIWQAAMTGEISQEGSQALSEDVLRELNDIHKVNKIKVTKGQGGQYDTFEIVEQDTRAIYNELAAFPAEGADVSKIKDTIKKAGKDGEVDFSKSFTMDDQAVVIQQRLLQDKGAEGIHDDLRNATKTEDVVKAIQKYETSRADAQKEIQDIQQNIETNTQAVNAILASITDGKFETKATAKDTLQQLEGILPPEIKEALKYKSGAEAELTEAQAQFVDDVNLYSLAKNPKAISRLGEYAAELQQDVELLQQKAGEYGEFTKTMNPQKQPPLSMNDNFNHQETLNNSHLLYDAIVTSKMQKLEEVNPQNKAELEKLSTQMEPKSFAMIAAKIETGVENKEPIDLMVASYEKKYQQNIESFVDKAHVVSSLQNKEERVAVMQRAMEQNIDVGQLKEIVNIANTKQHLPAVEIMKLSEKGRDVGVELAALNEITTDKSKQAGVLEFSNHISRSIDRLNNDLSDTRTQDEKDKNLNQTAKSDDGKVQFWVKNKGIATLNAQEKEDFATVISKIQEIQPNSKPIESRVLVDNLVKNKDQLSDLARMYDRKELYANSEALNKALTKGEGAQDIELHTAPYGRRNDADIERQFNYDSALEKVNQFKSIESNKKEERVEQSIAKSSKQELLEDFLVVNNFGKDHVRHLDHKGLQDLARDCSERMQNGELLDKDKKQARLEYLAVAREAHYRVDGKFAYSTQMLAIINNFEHGTHVVNEVQTGQGKSLISSITASALAASGCSVDVCTSNMDLARRDLEEQKKFFDYMGVKYSTEPIGQRSGADQYAHGGINYSTIPELSLYKQNMEVKAASEEQSADKTKYQTALVADEFDAAANMTTVMRLAQPIESLDKGEDSKYRIVYKVANKFIDNQNEKELAQKNIGELVDELKAAVEKGEQGKFGITDPKDFNNFVKRLDEYLEQEPSKRDEKLSELLTAAHQAKMLEEGKDFKVAEQEIEGKKYQTAKVLSGGMTTENVYSGGVHQCLHARLDDQRKANDQDKNKPKFVVNAESQVISSETVKNFMDSYDIINGYTGTHGHDAELSGYDKRIKAYQVPKHQEHNRKDQEAQFAKEPEQQQQKINKFIDKLPGKSTEERQPILIVAENDAEAKKMYDAIVKARPNEQVQLVDSSKKDIEPDTRAAGAKGMITISTSRMSRGTDIKPEHIKGLAVITTYADFRRVEGQIRGRSGRQDAQGVAVQILDENDLKKKLSESTGQEITKSGKKLLKEYHKHKEADNLKSVQDKQLEGDLRKAFVLMKQEEAKAGDLTEIAQRRFNEVVDSRTSETQEINVKEVEQELAKNNAPFVRELRSIAANSESQLLEAELKEAYVRTEEKSGVNKEQAEQAFADKWQAAAADSKGNAEQTKEVLLKDNPVLKEKLEEVQKEPEFAKKRSQQQLEDMEQAYIKAEPERHRVQTLKDANKEFSQAWKGAVSDNKGNVEAAKDKMLEKYTEQNLQKKLDVVTRANENKQGQDESQQEAKQTEKEKTSKLKKSDLKKAEAKAEERSDNIVKQKKEPQANKEPAQEEAKKWAPAQAPKAEQGAASAARSQQQARSNAQGLDATSQVQMAEQSRTQEQGRNNRSADPATLLQQSLEEDAKAKSDDQKDKSTRVRKGDSQKAAKQTVGKKPEDIAPKDKSFTERVVSGIRGMFASNKDNAVAKGQDNKVQKDDGVKKVNSQSRQDSKEQKPAKKSSIKIGLARQAQRIGGQIPQPKKQEQDLSRPPGLGQEVSQQQRGTSKNSESRDKSNLRIRPTSKNDGLGR